MALDRHEEALVRRIAESLERISLTASHIRGVLAIIASRMPGAGLTPAQEQEERDLAISLSALLKESRQTLQAALDAAEIKP